MVRSPGHLPGGLEGGTPLLHPGERGLPGPGPGTHRTRVSLGRVRSPRLPGFPPAGHPFSPADPGGGGARQHLRGIQGLPQGLRRPRPGRAAPYPGGHGAGAPPAARGGAGGGFPRGRGRLRPALDRGPGVPGSSLQSAPVRLELPYPEHPRALGSRPRSPGNRAGRTAPPEGGYPPVLEGDPLPLLRAFHGPGGPGRADRRPGRPNPGPELQHRGPGFPGGAL